MPQFRSDFLVHGDLVFPEDNQRGMLLDDGPWSISLHNGSKDPDHNVIDLTAIVIGPAAAIADASNVHRETLAKALDTLALAASSRFKIFRPLRTIEWEPGIGPRDLRVFYEQDGKYPPVPQLQEQLFITARQISLDTRPFISRALKYYRYGLLDPSPDDQFVKFWHALETIAENVKERDRVAITCANCKNQIVCQCGHAASRFPMAKDAIEQLIATEVPEDAPRMSRLMSDARNALMHGGDAATVERRTGVSLQQIVEDLSVIVLSALQRLTVPEEPEFAFSRPESIANLRLVASGLFRFENRGPENQPPDNKIPQPKITVQHGYREAEQA